LTGRSSDALLTVDEGAERVSEVWTLVRGDDVLAELHVTEKDFPWLRARLVPTRGFASVAPLFAAELRALAELDATESPEAEAAWEHACTQIRSQTTLTDPDGRAVPEFLLHIDGRDAWWRWSDEPFDPAPAG
jgi:hypothetical protein